MTGRWLFWLLLFISYGGLVSKTGVFETERRHHGWKRKDGVFSFHKPVQNETFHISDRGRVLKQRRVVGLVRKFVFLIIACIIVFLWGYWAKFGTEQLGHKEKLSDRLNYQFIVKPRCELYSEDNWPNVKTENTTCQEAMEQFKSM